MEINRAQLRGQLRIALEDEDPNTPKWSDSTLNQCLNWAITLHTSELPFSAQQSFEASGNQYELPDLAVKIFRVFGPFGDGQDRFIKSATRDAFTGIWVAGEEPICFVEDFPEDGYFYLPYAPTSDFTLYYGTRRDELTDDATALNLGRRAWSVVAIVTLAGAAAFDPKAASRANLEQWASKVDQRVDNPLDQEAARRYHRYEELMLKYAQPLAFGS